MSLILGPMDVFPGAETESIRGTLEAAAPACASGITWTVSVYEGPDLAGPRVNARRTRALDDLDAVDPGTLRPILDGSDA